MGSPSAAEDLYHFENVSSDDMEAILAVIARPVLRKTDAGSRTGKLLVRSGATTDGTAAFPPSLTYLRRDDVWDTDPDTSAAWGRERIQRGPARLGDRERIRVRAAGAAARQASSRRHGPGRRALSHRSTGARGTPTQPAAIPAPGRSPHAARWVAHEPPHPRGGQHLPLQAPDAGVVNCTTGGRFRLATRAAGNSV
jgi:hypothetical protein